MDFSKVKLVATDMDGTLLNSKHELSKNFFGIFRKMKAKGILFAAASGRQFFSLQHTFDEIKDDIIFIAENGSYVVYQNQEILVQAMNHDVAKEQILDARKLRQVYPILCGKKKAYIENDRPKFVNELKKYYHKYEQVEDLTKVEDDEFLKIALCDFQGAEKNSYTFFDKKMDHLQVKISGDIWLDISHRDANKGRAIRALRAVFNISAEETMVFGDYLNDVEMLAEAHFSYAMENAHPEVKKAARFRAKSNDDDGVISILKALVTD